MEGWLDWIHALLGGVKQYTNFKQSGADSSPLSGGKKRVKWQCNENNWVMLSIVKETKAQLVIHYVTVQRKQD